MLRSPARTRSTGPLARPIDTRRVTGPAEVAIEPRAGEPLADRCRGLDGPGRAGLAVEQDDQGVPGEDQDVAAAGLELTHERGQDGPDQPGHLFGAGPAPTGESLGQPGEAGDVGEQERPVDLPMDRRGRWRPASRRDPRNVRAGSAARPHGSGLVAVGAFRHRYLDRSLMPVSQS